MKSLLTLLVMVCSLGIIGAQNQTITVSGRVFYGRTQLPARSVPVQLVSENGTRTFLTDAEGRYNGSIPVAIPANDYGKVSIELRDICNGQILSKVLHVFSDSLVFRDINFTICDNVTPPPPPNDCKAFFTHKADENNPTKIQFQDLSVSGGPIVNWYWQFGDNTTSLEQNPVHTYATGGVYQVTLITTSETTDTLCNATFTSTVYVRNTSDCNCTREYVPVCVIASNGSVITFPNKCMAMCAGYNEFEIGACDTTCVCPAVYDPVCVKLADGTIQQFGNACEAACKGYSREDFVPCEDTCDCPTDEYIPVCVVVNGDTLEYTNACRAKCAGFDESDFVQCDTTRNCFCPEYYDPVCVVGPNGDTLTFSNKCFAACEGYESEDFVRCNPDDCVCDAVYDPVCVALFDGTIKRFSNACEAQCAGFEPSVFIRCDTTNCGCPAVYDPVCIATPSGGFLRFGNKCEALCAGYSADHIVPCDTTSCNCPKILDPVCAIGPNGDTLTFTNRCFAQCEGYNPEQLFQCRPNDCICPPVIDPVCVQLADGQIIRYNNKCEALCNGFKESDIVACDSSSCVCPEYYDPVCVITSAGDTITFDNPCFARCKGYSDGDWFRCGRNTGECGCPLNLDPVCVKVDGYLKRFPNACVANCYGFTEADFVSCERDTSDCICPLYYAPVCAIGPNGDTLTFSNKCFAACAGYEGNEIFTCTTIYPDSLQHCTAAFRAVLQDSFSLTVDFKDFATVREGTILGWKWEFGDGNYGDSQNPTHTYAQPGIYNVTQHIATSTGCTASVTHTIYVGQGDVIEGSRCQAVFTFTQDRTNPNKIYFKNLFITPISATTWHWDFGDGYTSNEPSPTHTYSYDGVFFVRLTVRSADCVNTTSMVIFIDPNAVYDNQCNALFLPVLYIDSLQVAFRNLSSPDATEFHWDFGDGTTSSEFAPLHTYRETGIYTIALTITSRNGCTNTFRAILNLGTQNFTGNPEYRLTNTTGTEDTPILRQLKVYPNPVKNEAALEFNATASGSYLLQIFSLEGRLMQTIRESAQLGNNIVQFDTNTLPAGMYLLRIQTDRQVQSVKFIKQ